MEFHPHSTVLQVKFHFFRGLATSPMAIVIFLLVSLFLAYKIAIAVFQQLLVEKTQVKDFQSIQNIPNAKFFLFNKGILFDRFWFQLFYTILLQKFLSRTLLKGLSFKKERNTRNLTATCSVEEQTQTGNRAGSQQQKFIGKASEISSFLNKSVVK